MWALFCQSLVNGLQALSREDAAIWFFLAVALPVSFYGLLRPGEWAKLRRRAVKLPSDALAAGRNAAVLSLERPKNQAAMGRWQVTLIEHPTALAWLIWLCEGLDPESLVFPGGASKMKKHFAMLCQQMCLVP